MVEWWWLIVSCAIGAIVGIFALAICVASRQPEEFIYNSKCFKCVTWEEEDNGKR